MDLAATFGCTVAELGQRLTMAELMLWSRYHACKGLPWRRIEMHLARVAQTMAAVMGGGDAAGPLSDYLVDPRPPVMGVADGDDDDDPDAGDAFADVPIDE